MRFLLSERAHDRVGTSIGDPAPSLDRALGQRHLGIIEDTFKKWNGKADGARASPPRRGAPMCSPELLRDLRALQKQPTPGPPSIAIQIWGEVVMIKAHRNQLLTEYRRSRLPARSS